jgi:hypothetical protein
MLAIEFALVHFLYYLLSSVILLGLVILLGNLFRRPAPPHPSSLTMQYPPAVRTRQPYSKKKKTPHTKCLFSLIRCVPKTGLVDLEQCLLD